MKKFIVFLFLSGLFIVNPCGIFESQVVYGQTQSSNDGWENLGEVTADGSVYDSYGRIVANVSPITVTLYVKVIATKVLYKVSYRGKEYSVLIVKVGDSRTPHYAGIFRISDGNRQIEYSIAVPFTEI